MIEPIARKIDAADDATLKAQLRDLVRIIRPAWRVDKLEFNVSRATQAKIDDQHAGDFDFQRYTSGITNQVIRVAESADADADAEPLIVRIFGTKTENM